MKFKKLISLAAALVMGISALDAAAFAEQRKTRTVRLAVVSDVHYVPTPSAENLEAAEKAGLDESRMVAENERVFDQTMKDVLETKPDSILISGDMTNNGEKKYAAELAGKLAEVKQKVGGNIYVMNGNHDINNSYAAEFENGNVLSAERMDTDEFKTLFKDFGYGDDSRLFNGETGKDISNSGELSYAAEICDGVTLIVLDGGYYCNDKTKLYSEAQQTAGAVSDELLSWAEAEAKAASSKGNLVLAMCHYGVVPHIEDKGDLVNSYRSNYLLSNWQEVADTLADAGTAAVLTGHYHGNDISSYTSKNGNKIYDIQTASLVIYPVSWRTIDLTITEELGRTTYGINADTKFVRTADGLDLVYKGKSYDDLQQYTYNKFGINKETVNGIVDYFLRETFYNISSFKDDTYGDNLQGYLKKALGDKDRSIGNAVSEKLRQLIKTNLPFDTSFSLGDIGKILGIEGDIKISIDNADITDKVCTAELTLQYDKKIEEQIANITEKAKISIALDEFADAVDKAVSELQTELNKSDNKNYSASQLRNEISSLLSNTLNSVLDIKPDNETPLMQIINDAFHVKARGNETTEVDEAVKNTFGKDLTAEQMNNKRLEWNEQLYGNDLISRIVSTALNGVSEISDSSKYPILSKIMQIDLKNDGSSLIVFSDQTLTASVNGTQIDASDQMKMIDIFATMLSFTSFEGLLSSFITFQNTMGLIPQNLLTQGIDKFAKLHLAMIENYGEPEDLKLSFKITAETKTEISRIAGENRFSTAAEISKETFADGAETVVLANGMNYADALAGVPLANKLNAPILLTQKDTLANETLAEIKRLGASKAVILGGEGAISNTVRDQLDSSGLYTRRISGKTRFSTAAAVAEALEQDPTEVFLVYGHNYADALSVSTAAALKNAPILYLTTSGELNADTAAYLAKLKAKGCVRNAYVIGGTGVISDDMMKKAGDALGVAPTRVAGKNRYVTCTEVNSRFKDILTGSGVCIAKGQDFPDALAGGVFAAKLKAPLFLADNTLIDEQKAYLKDKKADTFYVLGGTGAVPDQLVSEITTASK